MAFNFLKKIFGSSLSETVSSNKKESVSVPETVLNRFTLNCAEFRYIEPGTDELLFVFSNNEVKMNREKPQVSGPVLVSLIWLRQLAKNNIKLYHSLLNKFEIAENVSEDRKHKFLWTYFRTGNTANGEQLKQFYIRGRSIVAFLDAMSKYCHILLPTSELPKKDIASLSSIYSFNNYSCEDIAYIIARNVADGEHGSKVACPKKEENKIVCSSDKKEEAYLLLFSAGWCGPSMRFKKEIEDAGVSCYSYIDVEKEENESLVSKYSIRSIPTTILIKKDGSIVKTWIGYDDEDPGQKKFVNYIENCHYSILLYGGSKLKKETSGTQSNPVIMNRDNPSPIKIDVDTCISSYENGDISQLQNDLYQLISKLNKPGSGILVTEFPEKDRLCECYSLCLRYDWMNDSEIREVWAENGFYCIVDYLNQNAKSIQDKMAGGLDLFLLMQYGAEALRPKVSEILKKAQLRGESVFEDYDYRNINYLFNQFAFLGATFFKPYASKILKGENYKKYEKIINDSRLVEIPLYKIKNKAVFISKIIESILNDI